MNDPKKVRKTFKNLFEATRKYGINERIGNHEINNLLAINSFSIKNVEYLSTWLSNKIHKSPKCIFSNFNDSLIEHHNRKIKEMNLGNFSSVYDDILITRFKRGIFELIINDFRINFNVGHAQNIIAMKNMRSLLTIDGYLLISVVVDPRYESLKYGGGSGKSPHKQKFSLHF